MALYKTESIHFKAYRFLLTDEHGIPSFMHSTALGLNLNQEALEFAIALVL